MPFEHHHVVENHHALAAHHHMAGVLPPAAPSSAGSAGGTGISEPAVDITAMTGTASNLSASLTGHYQSLIEGTNSSIKPAQMHHDYIHHTERKTY